MISYSDFKKHQRKVLKAYVSVVLKNSDNVSDASRKSGMARKVLQRYMAEFGLNIKVKEAP